jgi:hypothetical protein
VDATPCLLVRPFLFVQKDMMRREPGFASLDEMPMLFQTVVHSEE